MLYTKQIARDNVRNRHGQRVLYLSRQDILTNEAKDYLAAEKIRVLSAEEAKPEGYQLLGGGTVTEKPEHLTHLNAQVLIPKTHPRIAFRGWVDRLEAELLLCMLHIPELSGELEEILQLARRLLRCDVLEEPVGQITLCGLSQQEQRRHSHFPQEHYGKPHFMPQASDGEAVLLLNKARTVARQTELAAAYAFSDRDGLLTREDILQALNRISSMLYILMIRKKAGKAH